jgi:prepilin-type N-terminal cleavage/methylation domain-containing protein
MKKRAFTLAEVLITLGIIGVVAALTIPGLIASYQKNIVLTRLKKFYSMHMQTYLYMQSDENPNTYMPRTADSVKNPDFAAQWLEYRYKPYLKDFNVEKTAQGAILKFQDGSAVYFHKGADDGREGSWEFYIFCVDYKECKKNYGKSVVFGDENGKSVFPFDSNGAGYAWALPLETRDSFKEKYCSGPGNTWGCASLIMRDGWEFKDDYPIKF